MLVVAVVVVVDDAGRLSVGWWVYYPVRASTLGAAAFCRNVCGLKIELLCPLR